MTGAPLTLTLDPGEERLEASATSNSETQDTIQGRQSNVQ